VISPLLGGLIAAAFLYLIKRTVTYQDDVTGAAKRIVPILIAVMAWAFTTYLMLKGVKHLWTVSFGMAAFIGLGVSGVVYLLARLQIEKLADRLPKEKQSVNELFTIPLIFAAAMLSFAHGANDVANAVGPLAAINGAIVGGEVIAKAAIPVWVLLVGAIGISLGLALYGPKLIRTVGSEITELDRMRAFCIAMAAAITVIIASPLGLPVSSTHIAVGFLREYLKVRYAGMLEDIRVHHQDDSPEVVEAFLERFELANVTLKGEMLRELKQRSGDKILHNKERKGLGRIHRLELVKRSLLLLIVAAWLITLSLSGAMGAMFFFMLRGMLLP